MTLKKPNLWLPSRRALLTGAAACAAYAALDGPALAVIGTPTTLGAAVDGASGGASFAITTTAQITAGNLVVVLVGILNFSPTSITVASISDGTNSYSKAISLGLSNAFGTGNWQDFELWYVANAAQVSTSASLTITYSVADASTLGYAVSAQVSGVATASVYDAAGNTASGTSSSPSVTTGTLAQAAEIIFGCDFSNGATYTEDANFNNLYNRSYTALSLGYEIVAATTAVTHNPSLTSSNNWMELAAPFKGAGAAAATPQRTLLGVGQ